MRTVIATLARKGLLALVFLGIAVLTIGTVAIAHPPDGDRSRGWWDMWRPPWTQQDPWGPDQTDKGIQQRMSRHWTFMNQGVPEEYRGAFNPYEPAAATIDEGRVLYRENCARCHGAVGLGDGNVGRALSPSPALLAYLIQMPMVVDEYLLWAVSDGGVVFGTAMPAFKRTLSRDQIWKIVTYMRAGFPPEAMEQ